MTVEIAVIFKTAVTVETVVTHETDMTIAKAMMACSKNFHYI